jgi:hypothetical protein
MNLLFCIFAIYVALKSVKRCFKYMLSLLLVSGVVKHSITSFVLSWPDDRMGFDIYVKFPVMVKFSLVYLLKC